MLFILAHTKQQELFAWLLASALISDILDGLIARSFKFTSELGSRLDSIADILVFMVAAYGCWCFYPNAISDNLLAFATIIIFWFGGSIIGILRYGRLASFHTYLSRITAYALGLFLAYLFLWGFKLWLLWCIVCLVVISQIEEFIMMILLPIWTPNARGLYWVISKRINKK